MKLGYRAFLGALLSVTLTVQLANAATGATAVPAGSAIPTCAKSVVVGGMEIGTLGAGDLICLSSQDGGSFCLNASQGGEACTPGGCSGSATSASQCTGCQSRGQYTNCCQNITDQTQRTACFSACTATWSHCP